MKRKLLLIAISIVFAALTMGQTIEDFESRKVFTYSPYPNNSIQDDSYALIVPNPHPEGINTSSNVLEFNHDIDGGSEVIIQFPINPSIRMTNKYIHIKVWSTNWNLIFAYIQFKSKQIGAWPMEIGLIDNSWNEFVFDCSQENDSLTIIYFVPDFQNPVISDKILYVDDIYINSNSAIGSKPEYIIEDYENIPLNLMLGGAEDSSTMTISSNPDISLANPSLYAIKFNRDKDAVPWGGFWSSLPKPIDITNNKYVHVKVWKSRISPLKLKIEGGDAGNLEVESKYPQTKTNEWEDIVFDFNDKTGLYPKIVFMPDFEDPLAINEDITIYFDDIVLNNDPNPNPKAAKEVVFNVDMSDAGITDLDRVYISGDFGGNYGFWAEPGTIPENEMTDLDGDGIYTVTKHLPPGFLKFKFYKNSGWAGGDYGLTGDRSYIISGSANLSYKWQLGGLVLPEEVPAKQVFNVDMNEAGLLDGQQVYISGTFDEIHGSWAEPGIKAQNEMTDPDGDGIYSISMNLPDGIIYFKFFKGIGWNGGEWPGDPNRSHSVSGSCNVNFNWGVFGRDMDDFNLISDGHFSNDGGIVPDNEIPTWTGYTGNGGVSAIVNGVCTMTPGPKAEFWQIQTYQNLNDKGTMLYNDTTYLLMFDAWAENDRVFSIDLEDNPGNNYVRLGTSQDADAVNGVSQWDVNLSTTRTTYVRTVTMNAILVSTSFYFKIMSGADLGTMYIDDIYLVKLSDINYFGRVSSLTITGEGGANIIETDKGNLQIKAQVLPTNALVKAIDWKVINKTGVAYIDANGQLTAIKDGEVTVKATALDGSDISDSLVITLSGQSGLDFPIDFENPLDVAWTVFANGSGNANDFQIINNPKHHSKNPSQKVLNFVINADADPRAGAYADIFKPIEFTEADHALSLLIYKPTKTPVSVKVEQSSNGGPDKEIKITNTKAYNWEIMVFDFTECIGYVYNRITIFPDFPDTRTKGMTVFIDSISLGFPDGISSNKVSTVQIYPNPVSSELNIYLDTPNAGLSIFNCSGILVEKAEIKGLHGTLDVSRYIPGVYFIRVNDTEVVKFVK